ncbi:hypothetical protein BU14_1338s0001 [Porphyra umbilicalis]|uniref:Aldehyde dehydrogenase domain-containing protein n=1 Tax=Porphyra umbilicalis TaxID=2786 RepID=A0A1X6NLU9_PORUM|nr:hypothetical protein BU14_1338s0001 [Porphyra umbilicalis]|eukprot:OSX69619.1 hypothetical protein BU14_1338s0001 [Porphyra umbilicalis]
MDDPPPAVAAAAAAARAAQPAWAAAGPAARGAALVRFADALDAAAPALIGALGADLRRPDGSISATEVASTSAAARGWAAAAAAAVAPPPPLPSPTLPGVTHRVSREPYGLVGVVAPWNFPLLLAFIDALPALAVGAAVLLKPSEVTPRWIPAARAAVAAAGGGLADVLRLVEGGPDTGAAVVDAVDAVCFTGSVATGRAVAVAAARRLIPAYLELGGKDAAIVTASADVDTAAAAIAYAGTVNAGQSCMSIERVYVEAPVADAFVARLVAHVDAVRAAGLNGPAVRAAEADRARRHIADAVAKGATVATGGRVAPDRAAAAAAGAAAPLRVDETVLTGVDHTMDVMTDETFAPILPVMVVPSVDAAVAAANDSAYGLSGAVFAGTPDEAAAVGGRLAAGGVSANDVLLTAFSPAGGKTAWGVSGVGTASRTGPRSADRFLRTRNVMVGGRGGGHRPWWFSSVLARRAAGAGRDAADEKGGGGAA